MTHAEHTAGLLRPQHRQPTRLVAVGVDEDSTVVCSTHTSSFAPPWPEAVANARRIMAAWNGVEGIPTERLAAELYRLRQLEAVVRSIWEAGQRDQDLGAVLDHIGPFFFEHLPLPPPAHSAS